MKFFSAIKSALVKVWEKIEGEEPTAAHAAIVTISVVSPLLDTILIAVAGEETEQAVQGIIDKVKADLNVATTIINGAEVEGGPTLTSVLEDVKTNLGSILEVAQVKDEKSASIITNTTNTVIGELEAIAGAFAPVQEAEEQKSV